MEVILANCTIVDAREDSRISDGALVVRDGRIAAVGRLDDVQGREGRDKEILDLGGATLLPGLVNMHVHLGEDFINPPKTEAECAFLMATNARRTLETGVTTVRLVGEEYGADFALRRAISAGELEGPRIFTAGGALACTGGHGHAMLGTTECDGAIGFRRGVRQRIRAGVDFIKIMISGGIAGEYESVGTPQMTTDELQSVMQVAHAWGKKVTAHAGPASIICEGIECGLDGIEHGYQLDETSVRMMVDNGVLLVPTLAVTRCKEFYERVKVPRWMMDRALGAAEAHDAGMRMAVQAGVRIAMGTDLNPAEPYEGTTASIRETEYLVEVGGMTALEAIRAATSTPAEWLGVESDIGTIEEGKFADLIAVDGDPTEDISALRSLRFVMKEGRVVRFSSELTSRIN